MPAMGHFGGPSDRTKARDGMPYAFYLHQGSRCGAWRRARAWGSGAGLLRPATEAVGSKPYVTLHDENIIHPLKEVDAAALAWAKTPAQVVETLRYVLQHG